MKESRESRFFLRCVLKTPLHAGSGESSVATDSSLRRRADGALVVTGASLAGVLRDAVERLAGASCQIAQGAVLRRCDAPPCGCKVCRLFGDVRPSDAASPDAALALPSRVTVMDAVIAPAARLRVVDSVALERRRGAASDARKFDFEEVEPGARLNLDIRVKEPSAEELAWLGGALRALAAGEIGIGGFVARGFGRLSVEAASLRQRDLANQEHLLAALLQGSNEEAAWPEAQVNGLADFPGGSLALPGRVTAEFSITPVQFGSIMMNDAVESLRSGFDHAQRGGAAAPELPSASFRGALRAASERILRTLKPDSSAACDVAGEAPCYKGGAQPIPVERFCLACRLFGKQEWGSRLAVAVSREGSAAQETRFDHVAIDRFTGGARDGLKFDALAVAGPQYRAQITLDRLEDPERDAPWMAGLLALALHDLAEGRWGVGYGAARGHGQLALVAPPVWTGLTAPLDDCVRALWEAVGQKFPE